MRRATGRDGWADTEKIDHTEYPHNGSRGVSLLKAIVSAAVLLMPNVPNMGAAMVPLNYSELEQMSGPIQIQLGFVGSAESLLRAYKDQESFRELRLTGAKPEHRSVVPRPARRQATALVPQPNAKPAAGVSPVTAGDPTEAEPGPAPIAKLVGHYRSAEMVVYVQLDKTQFTLCPTEGYAPTCRRVMVERTGGQDWDLPVARVVAKRGYEFEGYDFSGPECGAFTLQSALEPPDANGTTYVRYSLGRNPKWDPRADADCAMTLYEIPKPIPH